MTLLNYFKRKSEAEQSGSDAATNSRKKTRTAVDSGSSQSADKENSGANMSNCSLDEESGKQSAELNILDDRDILALERRTMGKDWFAALESELNKEYFHKLKRKLDSERKAGKVIYPPIDEIYSFTKYPLDDIKVVIIGQDPYHNPHQAHGMCFSVKPGVQIPPSLVNIYKELANDIPNFKYGKMKQTPIKILGGRH